MQRSLYQTNRYNRVQPTGQQLGVVTPPRIQIDPEEMQEYIRDGCDAGILNMLAMGANNIIKTKKNISVFPERLSIYWENVTQTAELPFGPHSNIVVERQLDNGTFETVPSSEYRVFGDQFKTIDFRIVTNVSTYDGNNRIRVLYDSGYANALQLFRIPLFKLIADLYYNRNSFKDSQSYDLPDSINALMPDLGRY